MSLSSSFFILRIIKRYNISNYPTLQGVKAFSNLLFVFSRPMTVHRTQHTSVCMVRYFWLLNWRLLREMHPAAQSSMQTWLCSGTCSCFSMRAFVETEPQVAAFYEAAKNQIIVEMKQRLRKKCND